jgi:hypothetical protein
MITEEEALKFSEVFGNNDTVTVGWIFSSIGTCSKCVYLDTFTEKSFSVCDALDINISNPGEFFCASFEHADEEGM